MSSTRAPTQIAAGSATPAIPPTRRQPSPWMTWVLLAAAGYNLLWGAWVVLAPNAYFDLVGMDRPTHPSIWQCVGMIVGVYGIGYAIAAFNPLRHWPIVLVGFLGKILGPIGYVDGALIRGTLDPAFGWTIPTNDLIWWVPFAWILWRAFEANQPGSVDPATGPFRPDQVPAVLAQRRDESGTTLLQRCQRSRLLIVGVRHSGCTFCRQTLAELADRRRDLAGDGAHIVVMHQGSDSGIREAMKRYGLEPDASLSVVADPDRSLYRTLGAGRGGPLSLFGPGTWWAGLRAIRHGVGPLDGDGLQLGVVAVLERGDVLWRQPLNSASQGVDWAAARSALRPTGLPPRRDSARSTTAGACLNPQHEGPHAPIVPASAEPVA